MNAYASMYAAAPAAEFDVDRIPKGETFWSLDVVSWIGSTPHLDETSMVIFGSRIEVQTYADYLNELEADLQGQHVYEYAIRPATPEDIEELQLIHIRTLIAGLNETMH